MQTFLPYSDFWKSAQCLDDKRLNNQINEAKIIIRILLGELSNSRWKSHPAVKMWKGYENILIDYHDICLWQWVFHRMKNNSRDFLYFIDNKSFSEPSWLGNEQFHSSHRSNLLRKDPIWYGQFKWKEPNDLPYFWPVN